MWVVCLVEVYVLCTYYLKLQLPLWEDLPIDASLIVYTLTEIAAEKLRCIIQRLQCRDLFDLALLIEGQVDVINAAALFRPKAKYRGVDPEIFSTRYSERLVQYQQRWERELCEHVPGNIPQFAALERSVTRVLRRSGLL